MYLESNVVLEGVGENIAFKGVFDGELRSVRTGVKPYGFLLWNDVLELKLVAEKSELRTIKGDVVGKIEFDHPSEVGRFRKKINKLTFEMDIPYVRRVLTDKVFNVKYNGRVCFLDIECNDSSGVRRIGENAILAVSVGDGENIKTWIANDEIEMLNEVMKYFRTNLKTILVGWNVDYDVNNLVKRCEKLGVDASWINYCFPYDLRKAFMDKVKGLTRYTLEEAANYAKVGEKIKLEKKISELSREELEKYNRRDVELIQNLERQYHFLGVDMRLCEEVGLTLEMLSPYQIGDTLVLRRLRELGFVAPSGNNGVSNESYEGAFVVEPKAGRYRNVVCVDVKSMYPSIIMSYKIDVNSLSGSCLPYLIQTFVAKKDEMEKAGDKIGREVYKRLANAMYGLLGFSSFRFHDAEKARKVTEKGREAIKKMIEELKFLGYEVIYGDTDSVFYIDPDLSSVSWIADYLSMMLAPLKVEVDYVLKQMLMFESASKGSAAKKRYAGIDENGNLLVRGLELRRKDWCNLSKRLLRTALEMAFNGKSREEILAVYEDARRRMFMGEFDDELVISKEVKDNYKVNVAHYRAWKKAVEMGLIAEDVKEIEYVWTKNGAEPYRRGVEIDYEYYWSRQIIPPLKRLLSCFSVQKKLFDEKTLNILDCYLTTTQKGGKRE